MLVVNIIVGLERSQPKIKLRPLLVSDTSTQMGIPSYFKRLCTTIPGLVGRNRPNNNLLYFDFNCLIYHVLRRPDREPYNTLDKDEWERKFLNDIIRYTLKVINLVGADKGAHIFLDGVVPMAKIKQQRMRRFRSAAAATAAATATESQSEQQPKQEYGFNTNALTPGTEFMDKLADRLRRCVNEHKPIDQNWTVSDTKDYGEGEHKIMTYMRTDPEALLSDTHVIYGLDADLIVLALWHYAKTGKDIYLFREDMEAGEIQRDCLGEEKFVWFSITALAEYLKTQIGSTKLEDYCATMMILGNDFIPTSMTFRIKDGGHEELMEIIKNSDWLYKDGEINKQGYYELFSLLGTDEHKRMISGVRRKLQTIGDWSSNPENMPLKWRVEECFINQRFDKNQNKNVYYLKSDWKDIYTEKIFRSKEKEHEATEEYLKGMLWIVDYYNGKTVLDSWFYPWSHPPLWETICNYMSTRTSWPELDAPTISNRITPEEQLALVLPLDSWYLQPPTSKYIKLPIYAPEWFPVDFHTNSMGKRWLWECEPEIPIPSREQLQEVMNDMR